MTRPISLAKTILLLAVAAVAVSLALRQGATQSPEAEAKAKTPYKAAEIMTLPAAKLIEILKDPGASEFAKAKACQRLAVVGDKSAVPALAALLMDPKLAHYARFGLEPIPDPAVDDALRDALRKVQGQLLVGVINSIGRRKDTKAIEALAKLMDDDDSQIAEAAAAALGKSAARSQRAVRTGRGVG